MGIGHVHLRVSDLERALAFYRDLLGFRQVKREGETVFLSASGGVPYHLLLTGQPAARPKPPRTTGLYHVAIRLPTRRALARTLQRLAGAGWRFQGFSDHKVSEALYLLDPDRNGLELYADRPRELWPLQDGQIAMGTDPLDVQGLLQEVESEPDAWTGIDAGTEVGHVHLHVSDLAKAEAFYTGLLGLDVTQRSYPGALFFSAGGYHHHVGVNTWAGLGAPRPPEDATGLVSYSFRLPDQDAWQETLARLDRAGIEVESRPQYEHAMSAMVHDPDGIGVELVGALTYRQTNR
ncbi:MAG: VOC family protein [Anaerolineae bacterium]|nr:VOC family protein [Anaerolineae bacterium]